MGWRGKQEGGDTCLHIADLHCYTIETNKNFKVVILQLKKKNTVRVCHKPGKVLGTGVVLIAVNILKTKMSTHRDWRRLKHSFSKSGKSSQQK